MTAAETLEPHALARLLLDAAPHMELIERVAPYLPTLRPILPMLDKWSTVETDLAWAQSAPEHLKATAHHAMFLSLAKDHGGSAALWGAIGHEMQQRRPKASTTPPKPKRPGTSRAGGGKPLPRTEADWATIRQRVVTAGQLVMKSEHTAKVLCDLLKSRCDVTVQPNLLGGLKTGRLLKEIDARQWPHISVRHADEIIAGLQLVASPEGERA
jgi:hypothetical protein